MLWQKSKAVNVPPSHLLGIESGTYEAYCLDEAVIYFGLTLENMLEEAGNKPGKEERKAKAARDRVLGKVFGTEKSSGYADPAAMFG